ncbi:PDZ domain-containing protein MAGIX isoform X6 [Ovis canadensis]|uniref:PDZ domain-containing protein MAGIX isoform X6 n=1 Tax=Ovis canadensis TaxID=37174 RepID=UPI0038B51978
MERRPGGGTDPRGSKGGGKQSRPGARAAAAAAAASGGGGGGGGQRPSDPSWARGAAPPSTPAPRGGAPDPGTPRSLRGDVLEGSAQGGGGPQPEGPRARQFLARLEARPLAARAAADVAALVRRAGATLRLRPKEAIGMLYSAEIEVTDNRLPNANFVEQRPQAGDLVLHINGESTQGLSHVEVVDRIRRGGPRLCLVLSRPPETHPSKPEVVGRPQKEDDRIPDPGEPEMTKSRSASTSSPLQHPRPRMTPENRGSQEPRPEGAADGPAVPAAERRTEDPNDQTPDSPGPWLTPSEERLSRALGVPGAEQLALEMAAGRRRH